MVVLKTWKEDISIKGIPRTFTIRCKNGKKKDIDSVQRGLSDERYLTVLSDVTEQKRAEMELKRKPGGRA